MSITFGETRDWLDCATFVITAVGVVAAICGGVIALRQFIESTRTASHAHMHQMFCRYLEARRAMDEMDEKDAAKFRDRVAVAIYFLEEVYAWTTAELALLDRWYVRVLAGAPEIERRRDIIASWRCTVEYQICRSPEKIAESLVGYPSCYGASFLRFASSLLELGIPISARDPRNRFSTAFRARGTKETAERDEQLGLVRAWLAAAEPA